MNITTQANKTAQRQQVNNTGVLAFNSPSNGVVAHNVGQFSQVFKQGSGATQFGVTEVEPCIIRVRLVMHDACVLSVKNAIKRNNISVDAAAANTPALNELYFWKRNQEGISNV